MGHKSDLIFTCDNILMYSSLSLFLDQGLWITSNKVYNTQGRGRHKELHIDFRDDRPLFNISPPRRACSR